MLEALIYVGIASAAAAGGGLVQAGRVTIRLVRMRRDAIGEALASAYRPAMDRYR